MEKLPCKGCKGMCCGPVPISASELRAIEKHLKKMPAKLRSELENQPRTFGTCIFYDADQDRCGIHSARPAVCRAFGHYNNLQCFRNPQAASSANWSPKEQSIGILSQDFTWKNFTRHT